MISILCLLIDISLHYNMYFIYQSLLRKILNFIIQNFQNFILHYINLLLHYINYYTYYL